jgi:hypothetical protein
MFRVYHYGVQSLPYLPPLLSWTGRERVVNLTGTRWITRITFKDTKRDENCAKIGAFSVKMHFSRGSSFSLTWHSNAFPIEAPLIPFNMNVSVTSWLVWWQFGVAIGQGAFLQTYGKFMRQKVRFSKYLCNTQPSSTSSAHISNEIHTYLLHIKCSIILFDSMPRRIIQN